MLERNRIAAIVLATALVAPLARAQAHDESKFPDWSGQWTRTYTGTPRYDQTKPIRKQEAPLKPEYQVRFEGQHQGPGCRRPRARHGLRLHAAGHAADDVGRVDV